MFVMKRKYTVICILLALLMLLGACGKDAEQNIGTSEAPQPTVAPTPSPTPAPIP